MFREIKIPLVALVSHTRPGVTAVRTKITMSSPGHGLGQEVGGRERETDGVDKGTWLWEGVLTIHVSDWLRGRSRN